VDYSNLTLTDANVRDCTIVSSDESILQVHGGALEITNNSHSIISNCEFYGCHVGTTVTGVKATGGGVSVGYASTAAIDGCDFINCTTWAADYTCGGGGVNIDGIVDETNAPGCQVCRPF